MAEKENCPPLDDRYEAFINAVVKKTMQAFKLPSNLKEDFTSAAYLGFVEAAQRYDPSQGVTLETYSYMRVRGAILDVVRKEVEHSGLSFKSLRAIRAVADLEENLVADLSTISNQEESLSLIMNFANSGSLCLRLQNVKDCEIQLVPSTENTPEDNAEKKNFGKHVKKILDKLPDKEKLIIEEHYFNEKSFAEIIKDHPGFSKSWVSRLHTRGLERLALLMRSCECKDFID
jgi:RNA polymerase sigma factor for flagellar operon FliA